jgi:hypothetical protein
MLSNHQRRGRKNKSSKFPFGKTAFALAGVCYVAWIMYQMRYISPQLSSNDNDKEDQKETSVRISTHTTSYDQTAILLQQSPVTPNQQISRLLSIDNGWARWRHSDVLLDNENKIDKKSVVDIYAPLAQSTTKSTNSENPIILKNINTFMVQGKNPFDRMIDSFLNILISGASLPPQYNTLN